MPRGPRRCFRREQTVSSMLGEVFALGTFFLTGSIFDLAQRQPVEVGPGQEPWFKVSVWSLTCCVSTRNHLRFPNLSQKREMKTCFLPFPGSREGWKREICLNTWKILSKREGFLLEVIPVRRILLRTTPVFRTLSSPLPLLKGEFWGSGSRGIETSAADIRSPAPHPVKSEDYCFKQRKHHQSRMNTCSVQGFGGDQVEAPVFSSVLEGRYHNFFSNSHH